MDKRSRGNPSRLTYTGLGQQDEVQRNLGISDDSSRPVEGEIMGNQQTHSLAERLSVSDLRKKITALEKMVAACEVNLKETTPIAEKFDGKNEDDMSPEEIELWKRTRPVHNNSKKIRQDSIMELKEICEVLRRKEETETYRAPSVTAVPPQYQSSRMSKSGSSSSPSTTKARSIEHESSKRRLELQHKFEEENEELQDAIEDAEVKLNTVSNEKESADLLERAEELRKKQKRLKRHYDMKIRHVNENEVLEKEAAALDLEDEQILDSEDDPDPNTKVDNWNAENQVSLNALWQRATATEQRVPINKENSWNHPHQPPFTSDSPQIHGAGNLFENVAVQVPVDKDGMIVQLLKNQLTLMTNPEALREWKPKDLPTFYGKAEDWAIFRNEFERTTPEGKLNSSQNAIRLRKALKGSAKDAVTGLLHDPNNCSKIMQMLSERFGRNELVIESLIKKAESAKVPDMEKPDSFVQFGTTVLQLIETVRSLREDGYLNDKSLLHKLVHKLPTVQSSEWIRWITSRPNKVENLSSFGEWIEENVRVWVRLSNPCIKEESSYDKPTKKGTALVAAATTSDSEDSEEKKCLFCDKPNHQIVKCYQFKKASVAERMNAVKEKRLCFRCLGSGHSFRDCTSTSVCGKKDCKAKHHTLIHSDGKFWKKKETTGDVDTKDEETPGSQNGSDDGNCTSIGATQSNCSLSIVKIRIKGPKGQRKVYALLDSGSDSTVIDGKPAADLGISGITTNHSCRGIGGISVANQEQIVDFEIAGNYKNAKFYKIQKAITMKSMGLAPYNQDAKAVKENWSYLRRAKLDSFDHAVPQVLIGEDNPYVTAHRDILERNADEPMAKRTVLGWVLAGRKVSDCVSRNIHALQLETSDRLDQILKESFSLDSYGVYPVENKGSVEDQRALAILQRTVKKVDKQWECGLLWRHDEVKFRNSRPEAVARLISNERRMKRDLQFSKMYHAKINEYLHKGYISELTTEEASRFTDKTLYIPHFGVFNINKPGKLRLVFDAACKNGGISLNHHLLVGPDLIRPLPAVLMNFRRHNIAINGDIEDMFHRVALRKEDRETQRFLFRNLEAEKPEIKTYVMNVLIFGACSSPSSAIYVKNRNAQDFETQWPEAVSVIKEEFYCDDCLAGARTVEEAIELREQVTYINAQGNFHVKKWLSNNKDVIAAIPEDERALGVKTFDSKDILPTERVLGLWWNPEEDCFTFTTNFKKIDPTLLEGRRPTKRELSRLLGSIFDPLGFISNFKVKGLILLQHVWRSGVDWDDEVTDAVFEDWKKWISDLKQVVNVKVPRIYCYDIHIASSVQLHIMVDASEEACASVCYLRVKVGEITNVAFVCARTKVTPSKKLTIPRLELLAAVIGATLGDTVVQELKIPINKRIFWSDSRTVLTWIKSETLRYKEFVANRISRIHQVSNSSEWRWVPTDLNVADDGTRSNKEIQLFPDSRWLRGPEFLQGEADVWPLEETSDPVNDSVLELRCNRVYAATGSSDSPAVNQSTTLEPCQFSSYTRLVRAQAAVILAAKHWITKVRNENVTRSPWGLKGGNMPTKKANELLSQYEHRTRVFLRKCLYSNIDPVDLKVAELRIVKKVQYEAFEEEVSALSIGQIPKSSKLRRLSPFLKDGVMRLGSRLAEASVTDDVKFPCILPSRHWVTELLILNEHKKNGHQGQATVLNNLRSRFWIIDGRAAVRRVINQCLICRLRSVKPIIPKMGELPHYRLSAGHPPFSFTGADLFGPVEVVVGRHREKRWVCVFTCMVTRAIHLEVVYALSTDETMMALSRFIDQRGRPRHMYTDNGTNFVGAKKEVDSSWNSVDWTSIKQNEKFQEMQWHFTPPYSPHFGGAWERMVQSVKKILRQLLHERFPRDQTLLTMLKGAENIVNSRPLTYVSGDPVDPESLTPNHFLRGFSDVGPTLPGSYEKADEVLRAQWRKAQYFMDQFWQRWTREVLPEMASRQKWHDDSEPLAVGDLVFMVDENQPRNMWKRGVITTTFPGKDGQVRVVEIEAVDGENKKTYKRGVEKVCPLGLRRKKSVPDLGAGM